MKRHRRAIQYCPERLSNKMQMTVEHLQIKTTGLRPTLSLMTVQGQAARLTARADAAV